MSKPSRSRNKNGRFRKKRSDTHQETLEQTYDGSIPDGRSDRHLKTILQKEDAPSLSQLLKKD
ncbi:MAG TPA: hypothetical protein GX506_00990 [Firmicutes bacterium]|nr:hypothetical protein [Bacillota bacterium]